MEPSASSFRPSISTKLAFRLSVSFLIFLTLGAPSPGHVGSCGSRGDEQSTSSASPLLDSARARFCDAYAELMCEEKGHDSLCLHTHRERACELARRCVQGESPLNMCLDALRELPPQERNPPPALCRFCEGGL
ncbi:MAG: hypothetical protein RMJ84_11040 [Sandaracinaceae bacterium]|nr:hypothetical protein [Sandaracinaceae bacterium]